MMTVADLIVELEKVQQDDPVHLYADQEGLTTMEPVSVAQQRNYKGESVVVISAWEPTGFEPI
jgi:hypothetical protein